MQYTNHIDHIDNIDNNNHINTHTYNKKKITCSNCGKMGHEHKMCTEPIISMGIINIKIDDLGDELFKYIKDKLTISNIYKVFSSIDKEFVCIYNDNIRITNKNDNNHNNHNNIDIFDCFNKYTINFLYMQKFYDYYDKIKFLLVERKYSLGFVEFIRGKYEIDNFDTIVHLFQQMTTKEILLIENSDYDSLLNYFLNNNLELDKITFLNKIYSDNRYGNEYSLAKNKFNLLNEIKQDNILNKHFYTNNIKPLWNHGEWGFPKGRRNKKDDNNLACAIREFNEETGYEPTDYTILNKIDVIEENLIGTNNIKYKHIYYIAIDNNTKKELKPIDANEIGDIKWFTYNEAIQHIRPYHIDKRGILEQIYIFFMDLLIYQDKYMLHIYDE
jgi:8-oxo-dGTP pyrophosphatase MutT (NUDIX family)